MNEDQYQALLAETKPQADRAKAAARKSASESWTLADMLLRFELATTGQKAAHGVITAQRLADDLGLSRSWVIQLRSAARRFPPEMRVATVPVSVHVRSAERFGGAEEGYKVLRTLGDKATIYDVEPSQRSYRVAKILQDPQMIREAAETLSMSERQYLAELVAPDPETMPIGDLVERKTLRQLRRVRALLRNIPIGEDPSDAIVEELRLIEGLVTEIADRVGVAA